MGKFNLSEAAKEILSGNVAAKHGGQDKPAKLPGAVAYGTKEAGTVADQVDKEDDGKPDYTKGTPTATPPGATPPVGSEPAKHLDADKDQQSKGRSDLAKTMQADANQYDAIRDRVKSKLAAQMFHANPGAVVPHVPEETEAQGDLVVEAEKEEKEGHEDAAADKAMIKKMMKKEKMKEDMDALLSGEELSEEFVAKATTIFEAAVSARAEEIVEEIEDELIQQFQETVESIKEDLAAKVDDYLNYMVQEWVNENQLAIEKGLRAEIVEDFIGGLKNLFAEHYIDIPEDKVDVVEELTTKVEELEASLNEQIQSAVELSKQLNEQKKKEAIYTACEGLTQTQVEKMKSLAEGMEYSTEEEFAGKLETIKESYFKTPVKTADSSALNEGVQIEEEPKKSVSSDPLIEQYAKTISKSLVK
jgi:hypothetical protein